jgi:predicted amidohydrolase YtcJ
VTDITRKGGRIALGSDFPVESIDPLKGFYAAVTRLSEAGRSPHGPDGWHPTMRLSRQEALRGMTIDGEFTHMYLHPDPY